MTHDDDTGRSDPPETAARARRRRRARPAAARGRRGGRGRAARRAPARDRARARGSAVAALAGAAAAAFVVLGLFAGRILDDGSCDARRARGRARSRCARRRRPPRPRAPGGELLAARAGPISFPTLTRLGWRAVGARSDTVGGHRCARSSTPTPPGGGSATRSPTRSLPVAGGQLVTRRGAQLRVLARGATSIVTWRRDGRTCILAGRGVPVERLLTLASYAA